MRRAEYAGQRCAHAGRYSVGHLRHASRRSSLSTPSPICTPILKRESILAESVACQAAACGSAMVVTAKNCAELVRPCPLIALRADWPGRVRNAIRACGTRIRRSKIEGPKTEPQKEKRLVTCIYVNELGQKRQVPAPERPPRPARRVVLVGRVVGAWPQKSASTSASPCAQSRAASDMAASRRFGRWPMAPVVIGDGAP